MIHMPGMAALATCSALALLLIVLAFRILGFTLSILGKLLSTRIGLLFLAVLAGGIWVSSQFG